MHTCMNVYTYIAPDSRWAVAALDIPKDAMCSEGAALQVLGQGDCTNVCLLVLGWTS